MVTDTALALLRDGSRIPLSEPLDEARRLFRDDQYDADVIGIEMDSGEPGHANPATSEATMDVRKSQIAERDA